MQINSTNPFALFNQQAAANPTLPAELSNEAGTEDKTVATREAFDKFVGGTFYRQMLGEMQKSVGKPAFMHGGQAEETFRSELNSHLADKLAENSAHDFTGSMFELFQLQRG